MVQLLQLLQRCRLGLARLEVNPVCRQFQLPAHLSLALPRPLVIPGPAARRAGLVTAEPGAPAAEWSSSPVRHRLPASNSWEHSLRRACGRAHGLGIPPPAPHRRRRRGTPAFELGLEHVLDLALHRRHLLFALRGLFFVAVPLGLHVWVVVQEPPVVRLACRQPGLATAVEITHREGLVTSGHCISMCAKVLGHEIGMRLSRR
jgi:hypothetical protein